MSEEKVSRRGYVKYVGGIVVVAVVAAAGYGIYEATKPTPTPTVTPKPTPTPSPTPTPTPTPERPITLRLIGSMTYPGYVDALYKAIGNYMKANPNIKISIDETTWDDVAVKTKKAHAAGVDYDIQENSATEQFWEVAQMEDYKYFVDLSDVVKKLGGTDYYFERELKIVTYPPTGEIFGLPWFHNAMTLWYRHDWAEANNLKPPTTWNDYLAICETLTDKKKGIYGTVLTTKPSYFLSSFPWSLMMGNGGGLCDAEGRVKFDCKENIETLEFLKKLWKYCPPGSADYGAGELRTTFAMERVATTWYSRLIVTEDIDKTNPALYGKVDIVPVPTRTNAQTPKCRDTSGQYGVPRQSSYLKEAIAVAQWLDSPEQQIFLHNTAWPAQICPSLKPVYKSEQFWNNPVVARWSADEGLNIYKKYIEYNEKYATYATIEAGPDTFQLNTAHLLSNNYVSFVLQDLLLKDKAPETVATEWADKMRAFLKQK